MARAPVNYIFHLSEWNDVDHIVPVIYKFLAIGYQVRCIGVSDYGFEHDYRIQFLKRQFDFSIERPSRYDRIRYRMLFGRIGLKIGRIIGRRLFSLIIIHFFPSRIVDQKNGRNIGIFEWRGQAHFNYFDFILAGFPVCALPHGGPFTFLNDDFTKGIRERGQANYVSRNEFSSIVFASQHHASWAMRHGFSREKISVLGSTRFCPEWQRINLQLLQPFKPKGSESKRLKVVFFIPHWTYNVNADEVYRALFCLASDSEIYLVVKAHTRGAWSIRAQFFESLSNVELNSSEPSPSLVRWSDVVVNVSSSIAFEAVIQGRPVIHARWCHDNQTIFDNELVFHVANDIDQFSELIEESKSGSLSAGDINLVSDHLGFGLGKDVLMRHVDHIKSLSSHPDM